MESQEKRNLEIDQRVNDLDARIRRHADDTLRQIYDDYQKLLIERIRLEQVLAENDLKSGGTSGARRHQILADVRTSLLDSNAISLRSM